MAVSAEDFLSRWQQLHLSERQELEYESCAVKADTLRNLLAHVQNGTHGQKPLVSPDAAYHLSNQYADAYASLVDSPQEQQGLDNFSEGALTIAEGKSNESQKWRSSLTLDRVKDTSHVTGFLLANQAAHKINHSIGDENTVIVLEKTQMETTHSLQSHDTKQVPNTEPKPLFRPSVKQAGPITNTVPPTSGQERNSPPPQQSSRHNFWSLNKRSEASNTGRPHETYSNPGREEGSISGTGLFAKTYEEPSRRLESNKRSREPEEREDISAFRTAKQQLVIENQKKYNHAQGASLSTTSYGTNKKSLGTRRGINSRFVPPVLSRDEDDDSEDVLMKKVTSSVFGGTSGGKKKGNPSDEITDERLKNIEPKMIELITSEIMDHGPPVSWDDIAGLEFAKKTIKEIVVWPMLRPDIFTGLRGPPKGLLLFGPPGTGKTLIGKCIASQSKSTFFSISASSLTSKWVGEGEKMVRALFAVARVHQPAVIFIDEIDSLLSQRSDGEHEASRRIKTEFLVQLDGATTGAEDRILVVGATNRPQEIDEAARRRFVKRLYIPLPEGAARRQIVVHLVSQQSHNLREEELHQIALQSDGYSGSDMANLCREAALGPIRSVDFEEIENITADQVRPISFIDFQDALKQVRASVSEKDLSVYLDWNKQYGSWDIS